MHAIQHDHEIDSDEEARENCSSELTPPRWQRRLAGMADGRGGASCGQRGDSLLTGG
jgi:hypothetical protein